MKLFALATGLMTVIASCVTMHVDNTDMAFVNDPQVIGSWVSVDYLPEPLLFKPGETHNKPDLYIAGLTFKPEGKTSDPTLTWTKGFVMSKTNQVANSYEIKQIDGTSYLFMQWKTGDYSSLGMKPRYVAMKKQ